MSDSPSSESRHITGVGYDPERKLPRIEWRSPSDKGLLLLPDSLAWRLSTTRLCIGYRAPDSHSLVACPEQVRGHTAQCESCRERAMIVPCLRCRGDLCRNPARAPVCIQPENHGVYIASFGTGRVKVGVASWRRVRSRVREQGGRVALIVGRADGLKVRRMEAHLVAMGLKDQMGLSEHAASLADTADDATLLSELRQIAHDLRLRTPLLPWLEDHEVEEVSWRYDPLDGAIGWHLQPGSGLHGKVALAAGNIVALRRADGSHIVFDLKHLVGYEIQDDPNPDPFEQRLPGLF
jgi:hypothetical protein